MKERVDVYLISKDANVVRQKKKAEAAEEKIDDEELQMEAELAAEEEQFLKANGRKYCLANPYCKPTDLDKIEETYEFNVLKRVRFHKMPEPKEEADSLIFYLTFIFRDTLFRVRETSKILVLSLFTTVREIFRELRAYYEEREKKNQ